MDLKVDEKKIIAFDLDDTLYNEIDFLRSGFKSIATELQDDWKPLLAQMFALYRTGDDAFKFVHQNYDMSIHKQLEIYRFHIPEIKPFPGVRSLFKDIVSYGGKIAVITDGRSRTQRNKIKALGLNTWIQEIIISEETGHEKPDPFNFKLIEETFPGHAYCYVGDNLSKDFLIPNKLGWDTICLMDNGRNIHFNTFECIDDPLYCPGAFIEKFNDLKVFSEFQK
ncbi:MAG: HAD-IA family hydrolase [Flavobacteriaceae bacterium]|nr:HAD-IA family hydrolase [Flavobacteriaceae bacterium]